MYFEALNDNWEISSKYLEQQGAQDAARQIGVKLKSVHTVVPHVYRCHFTFYPLHLLLADLYSP
jgi:hypothetical protein